MTDDVEGGVETVRITFSGTSKLDEAMRRVQPRARAFLLRCFADAGLRARRANKDGGEDVNLEPWEIGAANVKSRPVVVRVVIFAESAHDALSDALRAIPSGVPNARAFRSELVRSLAASGLALGKQPVFGESVVPLRGQSVPSDADTVVSSDGTSPVGHTPVEQASASPSHAVRPAPLPASLLASSVRLA